MVSTPAVREDLPRINTSLPGPQAQALIQRDQEVLSPSYTRCYPLVASSGRGAMVEDVDGNWFLDFAAGIATCSTGHCHPEVVSAIRRQAGELIHMSGTDFYYPSMVDLAEKLAAIAPGDVPRRVYFGNSGTEAIEAAMKLARYHTGRQQFISFFGGFHGRTMGSLSLTGSKAVQRRGFGPLVPGVQHVPYPYPYRFPGTPEECVEHTIASIETLFRTVLPPEEVAGIVFEPIQGEGGYVVPPPVFFTRIAELAQRYGILLIADEVQCGMGRTGRMWACDHFGFVPDILTSAKGIASGLPLSAMIARSELMNWPPGAHASTFGGNPVAVAASLATIHLLERELMANAADVGGWIMDRMQDWPRRFRFVGEVRGLGLMIGIEMVRDQQTKERAPDLRDRVEMMAFERGLLV
ncbi:MAG TPA: acetyl ornithine aminotransferase family protein, partial [Bryobacteraceae bacterium]|nr:acetyl ornithine aminotransferase family protein [Bryobacteraceae bacterium]